LTAVRIFLAAWLAMLGLFAAPRVRATRGRRVTLVNVRPFPLQAAAASRLGDRAPKLTASAHQPATAGRGQVAAAGPR
jgi:hypothetical protein